MLPVLLASLQDPVVPWSLNNGFQTEPDFVCAKISFKDPDCDFFLVTSAPDFCVFFKTKYVQPTESYLMDPFTTSLYRYISNYRIVHIVN